VTRPGGEGALPLLRLAPWGLVVAVTAILALPLTSAAQAESTARQTASVTFTTTEPGASTGLEWAIYWRNPEDPNAKPPAVQETIVVFPSGTRFDFSAPDQCKASDAELTAMGADSCTPGSIVGTGQIDVDTGSLTPSLFPRIIHNDLTNLNDENQSILFAESTNLPGSQTRTVTRARVAGETITTDTPTFPGVPPPDPYLALKSFRLSVPPLTRAGRSYVTTPSSCPRAGWTFEFTFIYRDGVEQRLESHSPCIPPPARTDERTPQLRLVIKPRVAQAGRRTAFHVQVTAPDGRPVRGARVLLAHRSARTHGNGTTTISATFARPGRYRARATMPGFQPASVQVRSVSHHRHHGEVQRSPRFAGG
jgi:hypothetical protein